MADQSDRNPGPDELYDEAAPRSIFAATWFRAVLVFIVLGVIGAVAVPYILDAMNAPPKVTAMKPPPPATTAPVATAQVTPTPGAPPPAPATPTPAPSAVTPPSPPPTTPDKPVEKKEPTITGTTPVPEPASAEKRPAMAEERAAKPAQKVAKTTATATRPASGRQWFVQVGAFKDPATARSVAAKLRADQYKVDESTRGAAATVAKATTAAPASSGGDQYDVIISGQSPADLAKRLEGKGLTAEATSSGAVVRPSLPLRDAVTLSKELAVDGSKVQVRRAAGGSAAAPRAPAPAAASAGGAETLHRVSVGGFASKTTALATLKELEAKGYKPFLTRR